MPELMQWEKDVIINSMLRKSSKEIDELLDVDEKTIADFISISAGKDIVTMDQKIYEKKILREKSKPVKKRKEKKQKITSAQLTYPGTKRIEKVFKNRKLNFSELIPVRIDAKTYIYVHPGTDIEKARTDFIHTINNQLTHKTPNNAIRSTKPNKNFQL